MLEFETYLNDDDTINYQCAQKWKDNTNIIMSVLMILIVIIGLFGNAIVFFVILVLKEYRKSVSNWYVLQLALADTLFLLMLPFGASEEMVGKWDFPTPLCKAKEGILMMNYYASIFFLTIMSFDRYMAVTKSGVSRWADVLRRLDSAALISLIAWLLSVSLGVPLYLYSHVTLCRHCSYNFPRSDSERCAQAFINETSCSTWIEDEENNNVAYTTDDDFASIIEVLENISTSDPFFHNSAGNGLCQNTSPNSYRVWLYLNFSVLLVLPLTLICIFYGLILRAMMGTANAACTNQRKYRRRVTFMVLALVTLFLVSWLPWYVVQMAKIHGFPLSTRGCTQLTNFVRVMSYLNSALNPYFYSFMGSRFHQRFLRARTAAKRKSRFLTALSRVSWPGHDSNNSTSGGTCRTNINGKDIKLGKVKSQSDDESLTKSNIRTERTTVDINISATSNHI